MSGHNMVGTHPYAHPQHIKVVKHLLYVWHWRETNMGWVYSLNHRISPCVLGWEMRRFLAKNQKLGRHEWLYHGGDTSICTSTAYKGCQTPFICMTLMWDEYELGLQPQSLHFTMSYCLGVAQISSKIPKAWSAWAAVAWWGHIHMHIHSI